jgi:hypothetical protein
MWKSSVIVVGIGKGLDNGNLGATRALNQVDFFELVQLDLEVSRVGWVPTDIKSPFQNSRFN